MMKNLLHTLFTSFLASFGLAMAADYPVKGIPRDSAKFASIYETVRASREKKVNRIEIVQHLTGDRYLARCGGEFFALDLQPGRGIVVDDSVLEIYLSQTGQVYQYESVGGSKKTVALYAESPPFTLERFVEMLKAGESFMVQVPGQKRRCSACGGFGGSTLSQTTCRACGGRGWHQSTLTLRVVWDLR